jgi:hypothetical protein
MVDAAANVKGSAQFTDDLLVHFHQGELAFRINPTALPEVSARR